jgi:sec-independent protein translocase protein TatA
MHQPTLLAPTLAIGGLGPTEWIVIALILVLLFGARKLPELAHSMGTSIQSFKKVMKEGESAKASDAKPADTDHAPTPTASGSN